MGSDNDFLPINLISYNVIIFLHSLAVTRIIRHWQENLLAKFIEYEVGLNIFGRYGPLRHIAAHHKRLLLLDSFLLQIQI